MLLCLCADLSSRCGPRSTEGTSLGSVHEELVLLPDSLTAGRNPVVEFSMFLIHLVPRLRVHGYMYWTAPMRTSVINSVDREG